MSKTSLCIQMLEILYSRKLVSVNELAELLETNPRNIIEYKKELELAGYYIETVPGRNGGYMLNKTNLFPTVKLTDGEKDGLTQGYEYLMLRNDFFMKDEFSKAMTKISTATMSNTQNQEEKTSVIAHFPLLMSEEKLEKRYEIIQSCIRNSTVLKISYRSNDNELRERCIHPYKLYMYNNAWFVIAYCEAVNDFRLFKLCRIFAYQKESRHFRRLLSYKESDFIDKFGMKNGEWHRVKLKFTGTSVRYVTDYCYGKDQTVEKLDKDTAIITVTMQYKDAILSFVLSHGANCQVIEPEWLKEDVIKSCESMLKNHRER